MNDNRLQIWVFEFTAIRTKKGRYKTFQNVVTGEVRAINESMAAYEIESIIKNDWKSKMVSHEILSKKPTGLFI